MALPNFHCVQPGNAVDWSGIRRPAPVEMLRGATSASIQYSADRRTLTATAAGAATGSTWPAAVMYSEYLDGDGWVSVDNVSGVDCIVALSTLNTGVTNNIALHGPLFRLGRSESGSQLLAGESAAPTQLSGGAGTFAKGETNKARIRREGTTVFLDVSFDSGNTWENRYVYPTPRSGRLFVHVHVAYFSPTSYTAYKPQIYRADKPTFSFIVPFTRVTADGNSLTAVAGPGGGWPAQYNLLPPAIDAGLTVFNFAVSGQTISQMLADQTNQVIPSATSGPVVVFEDRNEFVVNGTSVATHAEKLALFCEAFPADTRIIIVFRGNVVDGSNPAAGTHSAQLLTYWQTYMPRKAAQVVVLSDYWPMSDSTNTTYFNADGVHYTTLGACIVATAIRDAHSRLY